MIPLKAPALAKSRLAPALDERERAALVRRMALHVIRTASQARGINHVAIVGDGADLMPPGIELIADPHGDLNRALHHAASLLAARGIGRVMILPADLPLLTAQDVERLTAAPGAAIAPDAHGSGTNALLLPLPLPITLGFGPGSFDRHCRRLRAAGIDPAIITSPGLSHDVDLPADLPHATALGDG